MKKSFIFCFIFFNLLLTVGCSNILIADNSVLVINTPDTDRCDIESINFEQPGKVCSLTADGNLLSISHQDSLYSIDSYNPNDSTLVSITTMENRIYDVKAAQEGFFYTRNSLTDPSRVQIAWSSYDKTTERTLTNPEDSVDDTIYAFGKNRVIFINNGNELIFSDSTGKRDIFNLSYPIEVRKIIWTPNDKLGFIIGSDLGENQFNLYQISLSNDQRASINIVDTNVSDMALNQNNELAYLKQTAKNTIVYQISNLVSLNIEPLFSENSIEKLTYTQDDKGIAYSIQMDSGNRSTIWFYDLEKNSKTQLISPIRLISSLFSTKSNQLIYSISQLTYLENSEITQSYNYITNLVFTIN